MTLPHEAMIYLFIFEFNEHQGVLPLKPLSNTPQKVIHPMLREMGQTTMWKDDG